MMSEDPLLSELGHLAKEEKEAEKARLAERWDRMAAGTLTPEEDAELQALAESSPEARETYEAFRPLGAEFQARVVAEIAAEIEKTEPEGEPQEPRSRLLPFRPPTRFIGWSTAAATVAASLLILLRTLVSGPPLPVYMAELSGGVKTFRGEQSEMASEQPVFVSGSQLTLVARPHKPVDGRRLDARGFLSPQKGKADLALWKPEPNFEIDDKGAVRLRGTLGEEIQLAEGAWTAWIVVGRKLRIPSARKLQSELLAGQPQHSDWRAVCADLRAKQTASNRPWQTACANLVVKSQPP